MYIFACQNGLEALLNSCGTEPYAFRMRLVLYVLRADISLLGYLVGGHDHVSYEMLFTPNLFIFCSNLPFSCYYVVFYFWWPFLYFCACKFTFRLFLY